MLHILNPLRQGSLLTPPPWFLFDHLATRWVSLNQPNHLDLQMSVGSSNDPINLLRVHLNHLIFIMSVRHQVGHKFETFAPGSLALPKSIYVLPPEPPKPSEDVSYAT